MWICALYSAADPDPDEALRLLDCLRLSLCLRLRLRGYRPNGPDLAAVLRALCSLGRSVEAYRRLLLHLRHAPSPSPSPFPSTPTASSSRCAPGSPPDAVSYTALLNGYARLGDADVASRLLDEMPSAGVAPNSLMRTILVKALLRSRHLEETRQLMLRLWPAMEHQQRRPYGWQWITASKRISCSAHDKLLYVYALLKPKPRLLAGKVLIFGNTIDIAFRLRLFLEKFEIRSTVLNAELPQNSRLHILEEFNVGLFGILIATDNNQHKEKDLTNRETQVQSRNTKKQFRQNLDAKFGVVRGIDFKNVFTVINFDMPRRPAGYVHRIGRTRRGRNTSTAVSLVSPEEGDIHI